MNKTEQTAAETSKQVDGTREHIHENKPKPRRRKLRNIIFNCIRYTIMAVALCVFTYSSYELTNIYLDYKEGEEGYEDINAMFTMPNIQTEQSEPETDDEGEVIVNKNKPEEFQWDFDKLLDMNADSKGWIKQDEIISYPILQGIDNHYYLEYMPNHTFNKAGSIFIDSRIPEHLEAKNCIIYGHNMLNDTMFGSLIKYKDKEYFNAHPTFDIYAAEKHYKYYVFSAYETTDVSDTYTYEFDSDEKFQEYIQMIRERSNYPTDELGDITSADKIITLSTCTRHNDSLRFIVHLVRGEEIKD